MTQDESNLNLLSIFHYVVGGITALFSCFPVFHMLIGFGILASTFSEGDAAPAFIGWIFILIPAFIILTGWALAGCMIYAGTQLRHRKHYTFCLVIGCIECMLFPFGTTLGIFTIVVLNRDPVKKMFTSPGSLAVST